MLPVLTPAEMGAADAAAIAAGVTEAALVERAGAAVARGARRRLGGTYGRRAVVVSGKGNNGADGRVAARLLSAWGVRTEVFALAGGVDPAALGRALGRADLAVDAMFGTGLRGALRGDAAAAADSLAAWGGEVLAVDIPSGVDGLTGEVTGPAVRAAATVCLAAYKPGLLLFPGAAHAGSVEVADIGIPPGRPSLWRPEPADVAGWLPRRPPDSHKWSAGGVFVVAGSAGMTGAARLTSVAALRAGAGTVVCGLPGDAAAAASGTEVITRPLPATPRGALDEAAAGEILDGLGRFRALVIGPGLGRAEPTVAAVRRLAAEATVPLVVDADGLNALAGDPGVLARRTAPAICTPHAGEYHRLAGEPVGADRVAAARRLAERARSVVLLKGPATVVAAPDGRAAINPTGGPALASAGTGDVLSGILGAFVATGVPAFEAAVAGAFVHGRAMTVAGPDGLIAGDLIDALPAVLSEFRSLRTLSIHEMPEVPCLPS